ncbi:unnamed protein product [Caenorhabditis auriculariae]|uniref:Uncharacterized protein n=1 Tax=Caenorhabditis auriculariae TaxID=2777116 RepID=A0A8S1HGT1_9PELO|nr:unnamed protein product [Caenorhabditis auriculariae]
MITTRPANVRNKHQRVLRTLGQSAKMKAICLLLLVVLVHESYQQLNRQLVLQRLSLAGNLRNNLRGKRDAEKPRQERTIGLAPVVASPAVGYQPAVIGRKKREAEQLAKVEQKTETTQVRHERTIGLAPVVAAPAVGYQPAVIGRKKREAEVQHVEKTMHTEVQRPERQVGANLGVGLSAGRKRRDTEVQQKSEKTAIRQERTIGLAPVVATPAVGYQPAVIGRKRREAEVQTKFEQKTEQTHIRPERTIGLAPVVAAPAVGYQPAVIGRKKRDAEVHTQVEQKTEQTHVRPERTIGLAPVVATPAVGYQPAVIGRKRREAEVQTKFEQKTEQTHIRPERTIGLAPVVATPAVGYQPAVIGRKKRDAEVHTQVEQKTEQTHVRPERTIGLAPVVATPAVGYQPAVIGRKRRDAEVQTKVEEKTEQTHVRPERTIGLAPVVAAPAVGYQPAVIGRKKREAEIQHVEKTMHTEVKRPERQVNANLGVGLSAGRKRRDAEVQQKSERTEIRQERTIGLAPVVAAPAVGYQPAEKTEQTHVRPERTIGLAPVVAAPAVGYQPTVVGRKKREAEVQHVEKTMHTEVQRQERQVGANLGVGLSAGRKRREAESVVHTEVKNEKTVVHPEPIVTETKTVTNLGSRALRSVHNGELVQLSTIEEHHPHH